MPVTSAWPSGGPKDWAATLPYVVTPADMNTYISNALLYLYNNIPGAATQSANAVYAGPTTGAAATPTFRALVAADIPSLDTAKIATGLLPLARGGLNANLAGTGGTGFVLKQTSSGAAVTVAALLAADLPTHQHALADLLQGSATTGNYPRWSGTAWAASAIQAADLPLATNAVRGAVQVGNDFVITSGVLNINKGTSFPVSPTPVAGDTFQRTDYRANFMYDGSAWRQMDIGAFTGGFPASPITNLRAYRLDRNRTYMWDGTRWLSEPVYLAMHNFIAGAAPFSANTYPYIRGGSPDTDLWFDAWRPTVTVTGTNNGSNYWTVKLNVEDTSGTVTTTASFTTAAMSFATANQRPAAITSFSVNPVPVATYLDFYVEIVKTGTPGSIYIHDNTLRVREIG